MFGEQNVRQQNIYSTSTKATKKSDPEAQRARRDFTLTLDELLEQVNYVEKQ